MDLGGTMVRAGVLDVEGTLLAVDQDEIEARRGPRAGLERMVGVVNKVLQASASNGEPAPYLRGIGLGATGPVDPLRGIINNPFTLPTWVQVPIVSWLAERFGVPVILENDADSAALGEYWKGAGQGVKRLYAVTVGTGIGTALVLDGTIYRGLGGGHPEGGHQILDPAGPACYCGAFGCWESLASGTAIAGAARRVLTGSPSSPGEPGERLLVLAGGDPAQVTARLVANAAQAGDPLASEIIAEAARYMGLGMVNVVMLFLPEVVVLSGGVMKSAGLFLPAIETALRQHSAMVATSLPRILPAQLGDLAGLYGAGYMVWRKVME